MKKLLFASAGLLLLIALNGCKKEDDTNNNIFGTVTDIDGNTYQTVKIGTQTWMMSNLKTAHYNDGTSIANITNSLDWYNLGTGAYCYYDNDAANDSIYGKLYNWHAVNTGKLAPAGWHVPSQTEYQTLVDYLASKQNGDAHVGGAMKTTSNLWTSPNTGADNSSSFSAQPAGQRNGSGGSSLFVHLGTTAWFWQTADSWSNGSVSAHCFSLINNSTNANNTGSNYKTSGLSVRCVKD